MKEKARGKKKEKLEKTNEELQTKEGQTEDVSSRRKGVFLLWLMRYGPRRF
jgi:hypothetical protein